MKKFILFVLPVLAALAAPAQDSDDSPRQVVLISIDGLRPDFYRSADFEAPTLRKLAEEGAWAEGAVTVFPSVTYPSHTSIVTGVNPAKHGILSNTVFTWDKGPTAAWYWEAKDIKAPTLWDRAKAAGKTVAIVRWPVSVGANADWLLPEIFAIEQVHGKATDRELFVKHTRKELLDDCIKNTFEPKLEGETRWKESDEWFAAAGVHLIKKHAPNLTLVHLINVDHVQHEFGPDAAEVRDAVKHIDGLVKRIVEAVDLKRACVIITGDHGFFEFTRAININTLFVKEGWMDPKTDEWKVIAHASGGQAAIYSKDKSLHDKIVDLLKRNANGLYEVIERRQLDELGAYPEAVCAISALEGYTITRSARGPLVSEFKKTAGQHGYLPSHPRLRTGFIAVGCGVVRGKALGVIRLVDVAPTVAKLLGFDMGAVEGKALELGR